MEMDVLKYFITQGPFAILFVWLLIYVIRTNKEREVDLIRTNKEREGRLHDLLDKFSEKYDLIIEEIRDIKGRLSK